MIYFIQSGDRPFIKIGYSSSSHIHQRIQTMQTANPDELKLLGVIHQPEIEELHKQGKSKKGFIQEGIDLERTIQNRFARDRHKLEWYHASPALMKFIEEETEDLDTWSPSKRAHMFAQMNLMNGLTTGEGRWPNKGKVQNSGTQ